MNEVSAQEVEFEIRRQDKEALDIDVTRCRFAEFFRALGEPELGALLICETDVDIASAGGGEVSLDRAQTIMQRRAELHLPLQVRARGRMHVCISLPGSRHSSGVHGRRTRQTPLAARRRTYPGSRNRT